MRFQICAVLLGSLASLVALNSLTLIAPTHSAASAYQTSEVSTGFFHRGSGR
ncbi:MAG TPA: hypothetical protein V6D18_14070 [Thermosynechococcaceae cyanobacterium]